MTTSPCFREFRKKLILFLFLSLFLTGAPLLVSAQQVVLKMGTLAPEGTAWAKAFRDIGREVEQKTNKQVSLRLFPGGVLGDEEDMLRKVKVGQIQGALLTGAGWASSSKTSRSWPSLSFSRITAKWTPCWIR